MLDPGIPASIRDRRGDFTQIDPGRCELLRQSGDDVTTWIGHLEVRSSWERPEGAQSGIPQGLFNQGPVSSGHDVRHSGGGEDHSRGVVHSRVHQVIGLVVSTASEALLRPAAGSRASLHVAPSDVARLDVASIDDRHGEAAPSDEDHGASGWMGDVVDECRPGFGVGKVDRERGMHGGGTAICAHQRHSAPRLMFVSRVTINESCDPAVESGGGDPDGAGGHGSLAHPVNVPAGRVGLKPRMCDALSKTAH